MQSVELQSRLLMVLSLLVNLHLKAQNKLPSARCSVIFYVCHVSSPDVAAPSGDRREHQHWRRRGQLALSQFCFVSKYNRQGLFKPAEAPKNMAPVDTTTTAMALSSESARGNHLTGRCSWFSTRISLICLQEILYKKHLTSVIIWMTRSSVETKLSWLLMKWKGLTRQFPKVGCSFSCTLNLKLQ